MISQVFRTIGRTAMDSRKVLVLGALLTLAVLAMVSAAPVPRVQAADFDFAAAIEAKLTASDAASVDFFGFSVSVSGDTAVVGAYLDDDGGKSSGSAYVFVRSAGTWTEQAKLTASDGAASDFFGYSVSVSGDTAVVGARLDDDAGSNSGSAYVFVRSGGAWSEQAKLTASDAAFNDQFGISVSVSGDTAVVGADRDDDAGFKSGSAYVFVRSGGAWSEQAKLTASDAAEGDVFGFSVSVSGDTAVVGADRDDDAGSNSGSAYVFVRSAGTWTEQAKLTASDGAAFDFFGYSVSVSGDTAVVRARLDDDGGSSSGSAYVFVRSAGTWTEQAKLTASDAASNDRFGHSVSVSGDTAVVGARLDDDGGSNSGSAYVFEAIDQCDCAKSVGFWKKQFSGKGKNNQIGDTSLEAYLDIVGSGSAFFGSMTITQANDIFKPPKSNNGGTGSKSGSNEATNPSTTGKKKKKGDSKNGDSKSGTGTNLTKKQQNAEKQLLAAWLNFAKGAVTGDELIETSEGPLTFDDLIGTVEGLLSGDPTAEELERAKDLAESVNKHDKDNPDCDTGTGSKSKSGTGSASDTGSKTRG